MSDEEVLAGDLQQTIRVLATIGGQMAERLARLRADRARDEQLKTQEQIRSNADQLRTQQQDLERRRRDDVSAARSIYAGVREDRFWRDDDRLQVRAGEALAVSQAMSPHDPLATTAHDYLRREIEHRHGDDAQAWTQAALAAYREELQRLEDRKAAEAEADQHAAAAREAAERGEDPSADLDAADQADAEAEHQGEQQTSAREDAQEAEAQAADLHDDASDGLQQPQRDDLQTRDPEAHHARETTRPAYPVSDQDNLQQQPGRASRRAARKASRQAGREAARGSGRD